MKWISHQTAAVLGAMALQMPPAAVAFACAGAIAPDLIDQKISRLGHTKSLRQKIFNKVHRGTSHWFGWWLAIFIAPLAIPFQMNDLAAGLGFGGLSHVLLDMLTIKGVPLLPFGRSVMVGFGLCSTGKISEYIFLAVMLAIGIIHFGPAFGNFLQTSGLSFS